jgi:hypothetical protein
MQISLVRARPKATTHVPSLLRQTTLPPHSHSRSDAHMQPDLLPHSNPCRAPREICTERAAQHPINRVPRTECRARSITRSTASEPHRSRWAALLATQRNKPRRDLHNGKPSSTGFVCMQGRDAISGNQHAISPQWEAELHRRDPRGIRALIGVRPPCSTLQRRPPRRSCSS